MNTGYFIVCVLGDCIRNRNTNDLPSPPGFNPSVGQSHMEVAMDTDQNHLILKKSWDIALGPIKQVNTMASRAIHAILVEPQSIQNTHIKRCCCALPIGTDELINYVHVWQLDFHIPDNDGGHDVGASDKGNHCNTGNIQSDRRNTSGWTKNSVFSREFSECGVSRL